VADDLRGILEEVTAAASAISPVSGLDRTKVPEPPPPVVAIFSGKTAASRRKQKAIVRALIAQRHDASSIGLILGIPRSAAVILYDQVLAEEAEMIRGRDPAEVFAEFQLRMLQCTADLQAIYLSTEVAAVQVGAVKATAGIYEHVLEKGQALGIIGKEAERVGSLDLSDESDESLRERAFGEVKRVRAILGAGDGDILDFEEPVIYSDGPPRRVKPPVRRKA